MKFYYFFLLSFATTLSVSSQVNQDRFINFFYAMGGVSPIGSFSKLTPSLNFFGKTGLGLNINAGINYFFNPKNAVGIDLNYNMYLNVQNDYIKNIIKDRVKTFNGSFIGASTDQAEVYISSIGISYSRIIDFKSVSIIPKICFIKTNFDYDFSEYYVDANIMTNPFSGIKTSLLYKTSSTEYYSIRPEISIANQFADKKNVAWSFRFTMGYIYSNPKLFLYEDYNGTITQLTTLSDPIHSITLNFGLNLSLKKSILKSSSLINGND